MFVASSDNAKIGHVAATYAPIKQSCPASCPLKDSGCYAQGGNVAFAVRREEAKAGGMSADQVARAEAREIKAYAVKGIADARPLRLHVSGDARTNRAAQALASAAKTWRQHGGGAVWTYTHAWRNVKRSSWGTSVSVLASVESSHEAKKAIAKGYRVAMIVAEHNSERATVVDGLRYVPCPQQTRGVTCVDCKLCMNPLPTSTVITFAIHGASKKRALTVLR
jgi:hypothetical protein